LLEKALGLALSDEPAELIIIEFRLATSKSMAELLTQGNIPEVDIRVGDSHDVLSLELLRFDGEVHVHFN